MLRIVGRVVDRTEGCGFLINNSLVVRVEDSRFAFHKLNAAENVEHGWRHQKLYAGEAGRVGR